MRRAEVENRVKAKIHYFFLMSSRKYKRFRLRQDVIPARQLKPQISQITQIKIFGNSSPQRARRRRKNNGKEELLCSVDVLSLSHPQRSLRSLRWVEI